MAESENPQVSTVPNSDIKLTVAQTRVLRAIAAGGVYRSESIGDLFKTYINGRNVDRQTKALRGYDLIELGEIAPTGRLRRPWLLTDTGRLFIAELNQPNTRPSPSNDAVHDAICTGPGVPTEFKCSHPSHLPGGEAGE